MFDFFRSPFLTVHQGLLVAKSDSPERQNLKIVAKFDEVTVNVVLSSTDVKLKIAYILHLFLRVATKMSIRMPKMSAEQLPIVLMAFGKLR